ncbi:MAG TPA: hypothetical protein VFE86_00935, partial [Ilumatobacteraceae bacterium]|nr:hypothetical protein [Ilumatobacteraceae bacterium]
MARGARVAATAAVVLLGLAGPGAVAANAKLTAKTTLAVKGDVGVLSVVLSTAKRLAPKAQPASVSLAIGTKRYPLVIKKKPRGAHALGTYGSKALAELAALQTFPGITVVVRVVTRGGHTVKVLSRLIVPALSPPVVAPAPTQAPSQTTTEAPAPGPTPDIVAVNTLGVNEGSATSLAVSLSAPPAATTVVSAASSAPAIAAVNAGTATFTAADWNVPQSFTVSGVQDDDVAPGSATVMLSAPGLGDHAVDVAVADDDTQGIVMDGSTPRINEGSTAPVAVHLAYRPASNVVVATSMTGQDAWRFSATPPTLTFTPANYATDQTVTVARVADCAASASDDLASLELSAAGVATVTKPVSGVNDNTEAVIVSKTYLFFYA